MVYIQQVKKTDQTKWKKAIATKNIKQFKCDMCNKISTYNNKYQYLNEGDHAYCYTCSKYIWLKNEI